MAVACRVAISLQRNGRTVRDGVLLRPQLAHACNPGPLNCNRNAGATRVCFIMPEPFIREYRLSPLGDRALVIQLGDDASAETALKVRCVTERMLAQPLAGILDVVPAVCTLALHYDPLRIALPDNATGPYAALAEQVTARLQAIGNFEPAEPATFEVPVCYGGDYGEDLEAVARAHDLTADRVIELHSA